MMRSVAHRRMRFRERFRPVQRRGVSILLVLALLSMTLALSYAMIRSDFTIQQTQTNYRRLGDSRQAAYAGLSIALRRIKQSGWAGVDSTLSGTLESGVSYAATFATGDASLVPTSPQYAEFPYRMTITSTGMAVDPTNTAISSTHRVEAVVRLIPRKLCDPPSTWSGLQNYSLYQWSAATGDELRLDFPVRIEGPILSQNQILLGPDYPGDGDNLPFAGQVDDVAVIGRALSATEIQYYYQGNQSGIYSGFGNRTISHWQFDEPAGSIIAQDEKDLYDGIYDGAKPGGSPAPVNGGTGSVTLDGVNDHVHLGNIDASGSELTILFWIKPSSFPSDFARILAKGTGPNTEDNYWTVSHYLNNGNRSIRFRLKTNLGGTEMLSASNTNLVAGQWTFIAAVYDGLRMRVFQNGNLANEMLKAGWIPAGTDVMVSLGNIPSSSPRAKYLRDARQLLVNTGTDYLPITGPITAPFSRTSAAERSLVTDELHETWNDLPEVSSTPPLTHPGKVTTYRLYPGGKSYNVSVLDDTLRDRSLGPDPEVNPLGIFYRLGNLDVFDNVSITGLVLVNASDSTPDIEVYGRNVHFNSVSLPLLDGSTTPVTLPAAIVKDDFRIYDNAQGDLNGLAVAFGEFGFPAGSQDTQFTVTGRAIVNEFYAQPRSEWWQSGSWWKSKLHDFFSQLSGSSPVLYFPSWLQANASLNPQPKIVIRPPQSGATFHWPNFSQPIFVPHPNDGGLQWELLNMRELR